MTPPYILPQTLAAAQREILDLRKALIAVDRATHANRKPGVILETVRTICKLALKS